MWLSLGHARGRGCRRCSALAFSAAVCGSSCAPCNRCSIDAALLRSNIPWFCLGAGVVGFCSSCWIRTGEKCWWSRSSLPRLCSDRQVLGVAAVSRRDVRELLCFTTLGCDEVNHAGCRCRWGAWLVPAELGGTQRRRGLRLASHDAGEVDRSYQPASITNRDALFFLPLGNERCGVVGCSVKSVLNTAV